MVFPLRDERPDRVRAESAPESIKTRAPELTGCARKHQVSTFWHRGLLCPASAVCPPAETLVLWAAAPFCIRRGSPVVYQTEPAASLPRSTGARRRVTIRHFTSTLLGDPDMKNYRLLGAVS